MALTVITNDTTATLRTSADTAIEDMTGFRSAVGRGATDTDITFQALRNEDGTVSYTYPNAASNGLITTTTRP